MPKIGNIRATKVQIHYTDPDDDSIAIIVITGIDESDNRIKNILVNLNTLATETDRDGLYNVVGEALQYLIDNRFTE